MSFRRDWLRVATIWRQLLGVRVLGPRQGGIDYYSGIENVAIFNAVIYPQLDNWHATTAMSNCQGALCPPRPVPGAPGVWHVRDTWPRRTVLKVIQIREFYSALILNE